MEIGCHLPTTQAPEAMGDALVTFAREAERCNIASLWVSDHVVIPRVSTGYGRGRSFPHPPERPYLEAVTALAAAAVCTTRARLGSSVFILGHRQPVLMAKMLASIDALSKGRLICGFGVGWWKEELEILGAPFHARGRQADEALRVFKELWTSDSPSFEGEFFRFRDLGFAPKPVQKPHPPIWIGGSGPKRTLRVVAKHAAVWNSNARSIEETRALVAVLAEHCAKVGRDPATIRRSHQIRTDDADEALRIAEVSIREGFSDLLLFPWPNMPLPRGAAKAAELLPRLRQLA